MQDLTKAERLPDGIDLFKSKVDIGAMMQMIEDCALWTEVVLVYRPVCSLVKMDQGFI